MIKSFGGCINFFRVYTFPMKFLTCVCFVMMFWISVAEGADSEEVLPWNFNLEAGYKQSIWKPGFRRDVLDFETEGLQNFNVAFDLEYKAIPILFYNHEGPVGSSPSQDNLFEENAQATTFTKHQVGVVFSWIPALTGSDNSFVTAIGRLTYIHTEESFTGDAIAVQAFAYAKSGAVIDEMGDGTARFYDLTLIDSGDSVAFKTKFKDDQIALLWPLSFLKTPFILKTGYYQSTWRRPSDLDRSWRLTEDDRLILYETKFRSRGLVMGVEPIPGRAKGLNMAITGFWGFDNDIINGVNRDYEVDPGEELLYAAGLIDCWYNFMLGDLMKRHTMLTVGTSFNRRIFATEIHPFRGTWESEDILRLYGSLEIAF